MKNIVYNEDCMDRMIKYKDNEFDLCICDPPYGINISQDLADRGKAYRNTRYREWEYKEWDSKIPDPKYFIELSRISKNQIIWGGNYFDVKSSRCWIVWDKKQRDFSFADAELAWTSFNKSIRIFDYSRSALRQENKIHPTQKPIALYKWLLTNYAKPGQTIFDSHVGSGSIRIACHDLGFDFEGCEIDESYFNAQEKRYKNHIAQQELFDKKEIQELIYEN